jgi:two-component system CheB/CheR fusion protein
MPTGFFSDAQLVAYLQYDLLPELTNRARQQGAALRIWLTGCATGEGAYALAILVAEALQNADKPVAVRIFATDPDATAIAFARRGIYPPRSLADLPEGWLTRYFTRHDAGYYVEKAVRSLLVFGHHDPIRQAALPHMDMVMPLNGLNAASSAMQARILQSFAYALHDGGYLVLAPSAAPLSLPRYFRPHHRQLQIYRRCNGPVPMPIPRSARAMRVPPSQLAGQRSFQESDEEAWLHSLYNPLPVGVVVVDRQYGIRLINTAARRLLSLYSPAIGENFIDACFHMAEDAPYGQLYAAIDGAFQQDAPSVAEFAIPAATGELSYLRLLCRPHQTAGQEPADAVLIVIEDITDLVQQRHAVEQQLQVTSAELRQATDTVERIRAGEMIQQLREANRQLMEANQELAGINAHLRATSMDFMASAEEAQAATEEVRTLNEEFQATNEELLAANDALSTRTAELQELAQVRERERARLEAILASMGDAVLVVDQAGKPLLTNAMYERWFGSADADLVAWDIDGRPLPAAELPLQRATQGEPFSMEFTILAPDGSRRWFEANGRPIGHREGSSHGSVVVIRDITERSLRRLQEEFIALASHELRTPLTPIQGALQMLLKLLADQPGSARPRHYTEVALAQAKRLSRLVKDLLDVARLQSGQYSFTFAPLQFDQLIAQVVEVAQILAAGQTIHLDSPDTPLFVRGDAGRLEQAVLNLLTNAITYAPQTERIDVRLARAGNEAQIQVQDYGQGIPVANLPHIFSRFYRVTRNDSRPVEGLGLGLYIAREIVAAHGGSIAAESVEGQGTTFTVRLPLIPDPGHSGNGVAEPGAAVTNRDPGHAGNPDPGPEGPGSSLPGQDPGAGTERVPCPGSYDLFLFHPGTGARGAGGCNRAGRLRHEARLRGLFARACPNYFVKDH